MGIIMLPFLFLVFLLCSVLYFYQYRLLDIYFILGYNPVLHFIKIISVWLLGALSIDFCVPLINLHQLKFLIFFLKFSHFFQYQKFYRFTLYTFYQVLESSISPFFGGVVLETKIWVLGMFISTWMSSPTQLTGRKGNKCVYTNLFLVCILICFYIHI